MAGESIFQITLRRCIINSAIDSIAPGDINSSWGYTIYDSALQILASSWIKSTLSFIVQDHLLITSKRNSAC